MSGSSEIIGGIAEGALTARVAEPSHGEGSDGHSHETACLNCGTTLIGSHCHGCGQAAHVHKTLGTFFHDLLHGVFHFEGKIWRTLPMLAWKPGQLTREYIDGRRASYVSPIALFLFVTFLTFAVMKSVSGPVHLGGADTKTQASAASGKLRAELTNLEAARAKAVAARQPTAKIDEDIASVRKGDATITAVAEGGLPETIIKTDGQGDQALADQINAAWRHAKENPELTVYKLQSNAYKYAWLLIVISVPFLWLLFPFSRRFKLYDHTVFVTYSLSFMLVLLTALMALSGWNPWGAGGLTTALLLYAPFHMYRQMRGTYQLSRFGALWRTTALAVFSILALTFWALALLALVLTG